MSSFREEKLQRGHYILGVFPDLYLWKECGGDESVLLRFMMSSLPRVTGKISPAIVIRASSAVRAYLTPGSSRDCSLRIRHAVHHSFSSSAMSVRKQTTTRDKNGLEASQRELPCSF
jgi:hypothetical protein